ncbi:MAG: hypothetical protein QXE79_06555 [Candidatus Bathyarchaeia archaeon]
MKKTRNTRNRGKIGYLRYTGTLAFSSENEPSVNLIHNLIGSLAEKQRYKGKRDGYYSFTLGQMMLLNEIHQDDGVKLCLEFKSARPRFLDLLVEAALRQAEECILAFSLKGESINFSVLKEMSVSGGDGVGEEIGNFNAVLPIDGVSVKVAAYPKASMLNIVASLNRESLKPSEMIRILFKRVFRK